jgi:acid phosphatase class B
MTPYRQTTIAIDFDRTFTSDIEMWRLLVRLFAKRGHAVYLVTGRHETPENRETVFKLLGADTHLFITHVVFCDHKPKRDVTRARGIYIDIWIDDLPELIGEANQDIVRKLEAIQPIAETLPVFEDGAVTSNAVWNPLCP